MINPWAFYVMGWLNMGVAASDANGTFVVLACAWWIAWAHGLHMRRADRRRRL